MPETRNQRTWSATIDRIDGYAKMLSVKPQRAQVIDAMTRAWCDASDAQRALAIRTAPGNSTDGVAVPLWDATWDRIDRLTADNKLGKTQFIAVLFEHWVTLAGTQHDQYLAAARPDGDEPRQPDHPATAETATA